ncbi:cytochrome P450 [Crepidotus variabilis]|uniref:Cytochrome P450 n=1 Tax=Crepidotus variabilis TaxID=179855 RepID=A0A9P6ELU7_9AGAR|nr:cytochrome P450 [Crepidotus variabilis]
MNLPPGVVYLTGVLPYLLWPPLATYAVLRAAHQALDISTPTWLLVASVLLARPTLSMIQSRYKDYQDRIAAERLGAVLPPLRGKALSSMKDMLDMIMNGFPGDIFDLWAREHGNTFFFDKLTSRGIITLDPDVVKALLATQFDSFGKGEEFIGQMDSLLGSGIFNADGEMWKFHRAMTRPFFTKERISDFEIYGRNSDISLALAKERLKQGEPIEFQDLVGRFTLDSATEFLFGQSVQSLAAGIPYPPTSSRKMPSSFASHPSNIFVDAFVGGQRVAVERTALGFEWPLREFWRDTVKR